MAGPWEDYAPAPSIAAPPAPPDGFDLVDDNHYTPPAPPPRAGSGNLANALAGPNDATLGLAGLPVDAVNWALRQAGLPSSDKPFLGSDSIKDFAGQFGADPRQVAAVTPTEKILRGATAGAAAMILPAGLAAWLERMGIVGEAAKDFIRSFTGEATPSQAAVGATGGAVSTVAGDAVPDPYKPIAETLGAFAGGVPVAKGLADVAAARAMTPKPGSPVDAFLAEADASAGRARGRATRDEMDANAAARENARATLETPRLPPPDTAQNVPESPATLDAQAEQLQAGQGRKAVMYPTGTPVPPVPAGMKELKTNRGVFHFDPAQTNPKEIRQLSAAGRENELLGLGPYSKDDIAQAQAQTGEQPIAVTERAPDGTEVKAAAGLPSTAPEQAAALEAGKTPGNTVQTEGLGSVVAGRAGNVPPFVSPDISQNQPQGADLPSEKNVPLVSDISAPNASVPHETTPLDEARAAVDTAPTPAQAEAGNYRKGHTTFEGLPITIENPAGTVRSGVGSTGEPYASVQPADYGYIKRTEGADGDHVDVYIGPKGETGKAFIIDQHDPATGAFDEHKTILGVDTPAEAVALYHQAFGDGSAPQRIGGVREMSIPEFKGWLKGGDTTAPASGAPALPVPEGFEPVNAPVRQTDKNGESVARLASVAPSHGNNQTVPIAPIAPIGSNLPTPDHITPHLEGTGLTHADLDPDAVRAATDLVHSAGMSPQAAYERAIVEMALKHPLIQAQEAEDGVKISPPGPPEPAEAPESAAAGQADANAHPANPERGANGKDGAGKAEVPEIRQGASGDAEAAKAAGGQPPEGVTVTQGGKVTNRFVAKEPHLRDRLGQYTAVAQRMSPFSVERGFGATPEEAARDAIGRIKPAPKQIGVNSEGTPIFEDANGVRSFVEDGARWTEPVRLSLVHGRMPWTNDLRYNHGESSRKYLTKDELATFQKETVTEKPAKSAAPTTQPEPQAESAKAAAAPAEEPVPPSEKPAKAEPEPSGDQRFHLSFKYENPNRPGSMSSGDAVVMAPNIEAAAAEIMRSRGISAVFINKRFHFGRPAAQADIIERDFSSSASGRAADLIASHLVEQGRLTLPEAAKIAGVDTKDPLARKKLEETIEHGVVLAARQIAERTPDPHAAYERMVQLYDDQPKLVTRTSTSVRDQAYSTPMPLAYLSAKLAGIGPKTTVYEPTAGNGALLITANPDHTLANELNPERAAALRQQGFTVTTHDATDAAKTTDNFDAVIANPPFGVVRDANGESKSFDLSGVAKGYQTNEIDHAIAFQALGAMADDGHAVLILGGVNKLADTPEKRAKAYSGKAKRNFFTALYDNYNVTDHFTVNGDLYEKQGAAWPVDVVVIDGRGKSALQYPRFAPPSIYDTWDSLAEKLNGIPADKPEGAVGRPNARPAAGSEPAGPAGPDAGNRPSPDGAKLPDKAGANKQPQGVRAGRDNGQPESRPDEPQPENGVGRGEPGGTGDSPDRGLQPPRRDVEPKAAPEKPSVAINADKEGEGQVAYVPTSTRSAGLGTLIPSNMRTATKAALEALKSKVGGSLDDYVAKQLGYDDPADIAKHYSGEQVDALASAIDNISRGDALIVGDQTGVGKGRIAAGLIRYAIKNGITPIFVTEKPNLYGDMYRDMRDIDLESLLGREPSILMTNSGATDKIPLNDDGSKVLKPERNQDALLADIANGAKALEHDVVFTTYNQMQTVRNAEPTRRLFLRAIAPSSLFIFDEAHNAGSVKDRRPAKKGQAPPPPDRAEFARELADTAKAVYYSSATYAKRPDSMDFYRRTDMRYAVPDIKDLAKAIAEGGVPLQTVNSAMLAEAGQYLRRERSFDGIEYAVKLVDTDMKAYGHFARSLRAVNDFSKLVAEADIDGLEGTDIVGSDGATGEAGVHSTNFTSVLHNLVGQYLLATKADQAGMDAVAAIQRGERPVITVSNTLESFLNDYMEKSGAQVGDPVDLDFKILLDRYLERSREVLIKEGYSGTSTRHYVTDDELGSLGVAAYHAARDAISRGDYGAMPVSPIDKIRQIITDAGYKVGEITGRNRILNYSKDGSAKIAARPQAETSIAGRRNMVRDFNSGAVNALLINSAGSTGLSAHDSPAFPESGRGQRHMIIAQAHGDINTHMQTLGRVNRTGQITKPRYTQLGASIPAEKRPMAVLAKKMAGLNANTTANKKSALTAKDVPDFINQYGDAVAATVMGEENELNALMDYPYEGGDVPEGLMRKVTGRITMLDPPDQERVMDLLETNYRRLIDHLDQIGENALEAKSLDLDAKYEGGDDIIPSTGDGPFRQAAHLGTYDVKSTRKPMKFDAVVDLLAKSLGMDRSKVDERPAKAFTAMMQAGRSEGTQSAREALRKFAPVRDALLKAAQSKIDAAAPGSPEAAAAQGKYDQQKLRLEDAAKSFHELAAITHPGAAVSLKDEQGENYSGVVLSLTSSGKTANPIALSGWEAAVAVPGYGIFRIPLSQLSISDAGKGMSISATPDYLATPAMLQQEFDQFTAELREKRLIVTGNLLAAFAKVNGKKTIVHFTTHDGQTKQGILLAAGAKAKDVKGSIAVDIAEPSKVLEAVDAHSGAVASADGHVRVLKMYGGAAYRVAITASRAQGGKYYLNRDVIEAVGHDFAKVSNSMVADRLSKSRAEDVIKALMGAGARFSARKADPKP